MGQRSKRFAKRALVALLAVGLLAQLVPVDRTNPPVTADLQAPEDVRAVLRRACYDCHSNETTWPWYSRVAPISWLVAHDVDEAREHMNFSTWGTLSADEQEHLREEAWEEVEEGEMPLWFYVPLHAEAKLDDADRAVLQAWAGSKD